MDRKIADACDDTIRKADRLAQKCDRTGDTATATSTRRFMNDVQDVRNGAAKR